MALFERGESNVTVDTVVKVATGPGVGGGELFARAGLEAMSLLRRLAGPRACRRHQIGFVGILKVLRIVDCLAFCENLLDIRSSPLDGIIRLI